MIEVELVVGSELWAELADVEAVARRAVDAALAVARPRLSEPCELSILLGDAATVRDLNRTWRGKDSATNVLSFPAAPQPGAPGPRCLGDIALAFEILHREAEAEGKSLADHASHLIIHGLLHLLGFDHEKAGDAEQMEALEIEALRRLGIASPYRDMAA
jgi:probable rRNA maturation factor